MNEMNQNDNQLEAASQITDMPSSNNISVTVPELPESGVHCFPANPKQVLRRRIATLVLFPLLVAVIVLLIGKGSSYYILLPVFIIPIFVCVPVFIQTFLIAKYRVAIDYSNKKVVLRYMFRLLPIAFEDFDAKLGEPDQVERLLVRAKSMVGKSQRMYLILDDINSDACYQTTSEDLASVADFLTLKEETFLISQKYRAHDRQSEIEKEDMADDAIAKLVNDVLDSNKMYRE